jgi:uncharacterized protein YacL (UPF0231 family)
MAGSTHELLDRLSELIEGSFSLPLGADRCIVNRDKALGLIDELKNVLPREIEQAYAIVASVNDMTAKAKKEAAAIQRQAEERAIVLVNDNIIVKEARNKAADIMTEAKAHDRELRKSTNAYVDKTLKRLEDFTAKTHDDAQKVRKEFRAASRVTQA